MEDWDNQHTSHILLVQMIPYGCLLSVAGALYLLEAIICPSSSLCSSTASLTRFFVSISMVGSFSVPSVCPNSALLSLISPSELDGLTDRAPDMVYSSLAVLGTGPVTCPFSSSSSFDGSLLVASARRSAPTETCCKLGIAVVKRFASVDFPAHGGPRMKWRAGRAGVLGFGLEASIMVVMEGCDVILVETRVAEEQLRVSVRHWYVQIGELKTLTKFAAIFLDEVAWITTIGHDLGTL